MTLLVAAVAAGVAAVDDGDGA
ncbi:predicted protein [Streptomyces iranensis]|uniref:Uncharacterized protein n=1 Tax=Streptomyces iranensis TaxID=576784 RepID=A0A060ZB02_9ACTN|nr:predicted protein [Streptomyces iranensis]